jgi:AAA+ superfamily predicted ATPase
VLLRLLEYQSGILFLTTNRIKDFDPAFHSRIHISISYPSLGAKEREYIWKNLTANVPNSLSQQNFERLAKLPINGRNVKNVLRIATISAKSRGQEGKLQFWDIKQVLPLAFGSSLDTELTQAIKELQ